MNDQSSVHSGRTTEAESTAHLKRELADTRYLADKLRDSQTKLIEENKLLAVSRLAAGLAHEINNPLGYIQSNLTTLGRYTDFLLNSLNVYLDITWKEQGEADASISPLVNETREAIDKRKLRKITNDIFPLLEETLEGVNRIAEIVTCFRSLERGISSGRDKREEDLNKIVSETLNTIRAKIPAGVKLTNETIPVPLQVMGTLDMLNIAFINLIQNAVEAVGAEGEIKVVTGRENGVVYCDISDSGPGIREDIRQHIMDPFFTNKNGHLGLGLTIAATFIHAHGGTIDVESVVGSCTRLRVNLPAETG